MPLSKNEIEGFKETLLEMRRQVVTSLKETNQEVKEVDESRGYSQHQADEGTDDFGKTISLEVSNKGFSILKQIDRALEKIEEGTYGICDLTEEEIPKKRLEAIPYASMTVAAQQKYEKERGQK